MMRNRVALDVLRSISDAEWCDFVVCAHSANRDVRTLSEPVGEERGALEAFRTLLRPGGLLEWDPRAVLDAVVDGGGSRTWQEWMQSKYLLGPAALD